MPRHIPRSHLRSHPTTLSCACGSSSKKTLSRKLFLEASDRCQKCDRIARKLPSTSGRKKIKGKAHTIVLCGLSDAAASGIEALAANGQAGETIGFLANEYFKENQG